LILQRTDGSERAQNHPKTPFSTLIEPLRVEESRGQEPPQGNAHGVAMNAVLKLIDKIREIMPSHESCRMRTKLSWNRHDKHVY